MLTLYALAIKLNVFTFAACSSIKDVPGGSFFGLPPWWEYVRKVKVDGLGQCMPDYTFPGDVWGIGFAVLDILLRIAGFLAFFAVVLAGVNYIIASGNPEKIRSARRALTNALIGLVIALIAISLVKFIATKFGG